MLDKKRFILVWLLLFLSLGVGACQTGRGDGTAAPTPGVIDRAFEPTPPGWAEYQPLLRQWAVAAEASSVYVEPEWGAEQATGPPDAPGCGDYQFAWASAVSDEVATLDLTYETPVYVSEIIIIQSFNPNQVVKVEVLDPDGEYIVVYQDSPVVVDRPCPYSLAVPVEELDFKSDTIRITVDQSVLGLGWNEIDAVRLVGVEGE